MARSIHPFPARMASEIALDALAKATGRLRILDPMCGSGTVLATGVTHGHRVVGFDLDPLAILMSKVATDAVDGDAVSKVALKCVTRAKNSRRVQVPWSDPRTERFARFWFASDQFKQLIRLSAEIARVEDGLVRNALQIALSRTIVTKRPQASLAADTAHSRPHRVATTSAYDVDAGFLRSSALLAKQLDSRTLSGTAVVASGDARDKAVYGSRRYDVVLTSPPYLNAIDYLRGHRLALIWFGYSIPELSEIRRTAIGSECKLDATEMATLWEDLTPLFPGYADRIEDGQRHLVARYAKDMQSLAANIKRSLVPGGQCMIVVADSVLRGNRIPTGDIIVSTLNELSFDRVTVATREIPAATRYLPTTNAGASLGKRMKSEFVVSAWKPVIA